ncbi:transglycosylase SLT domain-containing protein [Burkholderia gladioli]|uniref:transglycosylase SLT domain-containing protein n=1 Tax=Burkholderia gladioli TaxID=28095 RepID=UPI003D1F8417
MATWSMASEPCRPYRLLRPWRAALAAGVLCLAQPGGALAQDCWTRAGDKYGIDPLLLAAIARVESAMNPAAVNRNRNGTTDIGLMQINSTHLPRLHKAGITRKRLLAEPCTSIDTGAAILAGFIERLGPTWNAVGAYNAGASPARARARQAYVDKVWRAYRQLTRDRASSLAGLVDWRR